ncbi:MAG TPA: hypothetical protein DDZ32_02345 [Gammaproteobacteria bacterium]|nr:hypothetical protein [Gammaproteobacteria bacterium]HBK11655.1 hypothetical protein [Gammaproteobacteria bacterium]
MARPVLGCPQELICCFPAQQGVKALKVKRPVFIIRAALIRWLHQNSAVTTVLLVQIALGLICCLGFWWVDAALLSGALAGFASALLPNCLLAWQQKSAVHAARLVMHSVTKWVVTMMLMALSFGVVGADPISFFVTFVIAQLSFVVALVRPQLLRSNSQ